MNEEERIIDLIRKCLALANGSNFEGEATAALAKAQELLLKYNLDWAKVEGEAKRPEADLTCEAKFCDDRWQGSLVWVIAQANFCYTVFSATDGCSYIFGRKPNVAAVKEMVNWVMPQVIGLVARQQRANRASFAQGILTRIKERLAKPPDSYVGTALVTQLKSEARRFSETVFPFTAPYHDNIHNRRAYNAGKVAGDGVSFSGASKQIGGRLLLNKGGGE